MPRGGFIRKNPVGLSDHWRKGCVGGVWPGHQRPRAPAMPQCLFPMSAGCLVFQFPSNGVPSGEAPAQAIVVPIPCVVPLYVCFIEPTWIPIGHCVRPFLRTLSDRTGCEFSVAQTLLACAPVEGNSFIRARCGQNNACGSVAAHGRACTCSRCFFVHTLLISCPGVCQLCPTTSRRSSD